MVGVILIMAMDMVMVMVIHTTVMAVIILIMGMAITVFRTTEEEEIQIMAEVRQAEGQIITCQQETHHTAELKIHDVLIATMYALTPIQHVPTIVEILEVITRQETPIQTQVRQ